MQHANRQREAKSFDGIYINLQTKWARRKSKCHRLRLHENRRIYGQVRGSSLSPVSFVSCLVEPPRLNLTSKWWCAMPGPCCVCASCGSESLAKLDARLKLHFPPFNGLKKFPVSTSSEIVVCLDCGFAHFALSPTELQLVKEGTTKP